jgi:hypothetical protein
MTIASWDKITSASSRPILRSICISTVFTGPAGQDDRILKSSSVVEPVSQIGFVISGAAGWRFNHTTRTSVFFEQAALRKIDRSTAITPNENSVAVAGSLSRYT